MTMIKRLSPREFARAMKLGLGRTLLHVAEYGDEGVEEIIKEAMLKSFAYDVMFEGLRAWWLRDIIALTGRVRHYGRFLYDNFNQDGLDADDIGQQYNLAAIFFELGMSEFAPLMISDIRRFQSHWPEENCGYPLVTVAGITGLETIAELCERFPDQFEDYTCHSIMEKSMDIGFVSDAERQLKQLAKANTGVKVFLERIERRRAEIAAPVERTAVSEMTLDELISLVESGGKGKIAGKSRSFGRDAKDEELLKVLALFEKTSDARKRLAYLRVFEYRDLPKTPNSIIELLRSRNKELRRTAARVLARVKSKQIRILALEFISSGKLAEIDLGMQMLVNNYQAVDTELITTAVTRLKKPEHVHSVGMKVVRICHESGGRELVPILTWLFWNNPESYCRNSMFDCLVKLNACHTELAIEAQWDSGSDLQLAARTYCAAVEKSRVSAASLQIGGAEHE